MRDTSKIHNEIHNEIHVSQMHPDRDVSDMKERCGIHSRYMQDTCILRGNQDTCWIHVGYMMDTCGIRVSGVRGNVSMPSSCAAHLSAIAYQATHLLLVQ